MEGRLAAALAAQPDRVPARQTAPAAEPEDARWPDEEAEAAVLAAEPAGSAAESMPRQEPESTRSPPSASAAGPAGSPSPALPPIEELAARVPQELRETLDELFRARFVKVRRVPPEALKGADREDGSIS